MKAQCLLLIESLHSYIFSNIGSSEEVIFLFGYMMKNSMCHIFKFLLSSSYFYNEHGSKLIVFVQINYIYCELFRILFSRKLTLNEAGHFQVFIMHSANFKHLENA